MNKDIIKLDKAFKYACDKYYLVVYDFEGNRLTEKRATGILLNYRGGDISLLAQDGIYDIRHEDIVYIRPVKPNVITLNDEYKEILKEFGVINDETSAEETQ